jgi:hypothetical protein
VGISDALHIGFGFFGRPKAAPAGPALRLGRPRPAWPRTAAFPCSAFDTGYVRSALYTGSPVGSASGGVKHPNQTACHFGQSLKQPRVALSASRCLRAFSSFDRSFQFPQCPQLEAARLTALSGRLQTSDSSPGMFRGLPSDACFRRIPAATRRTWSGFQSRQAVSDTTSCRTDPSWVRCKPTPWSRL